jgi:hypothetical protein
MITAYPKIHRTRFAELGYWQVEPGCWSFVNFDEDGTPHQVGNKYASKMELLSNLEGYAAEYGCDGAAKKESAPVLLSALQALLIYADRYSEEMRKIGRGAEELGKDAKFPGVGWQARAAIHTATGVWAD